MESGKGMSQALQQKTAVLIVLALLLPQPGTAAQIVTPRAKSAPVTPGQLALPMNAPAGFTAIQTLGAASFAGAIPTLPSSPLVAPQAAADAQASVPQAAAQAKAVQAHALPSAPLAAKSAAAAKAAAQAYAAPKDETQPQPGAIGQATSAGEAAKSAADEPRAAAATLALVFDGKKTAADTQAQDPVRIYLTRNGQDPIVTDLSQLKDQLAKDPSYAEGLNKAGRVRLVLNEARPGGLSRERLDEVRAQFEAAGVTAQIDIETIPIDWARKEAGGPAAESVTASTSKSRVVRFLTAPFRELAYIARTVKAAWTKPTWHEIIGGIVSKGPAFALSAIWWAKLFLPLHPVAFAAALGFSLALQAFHGIWINTWQNVQNIIGKQRGVGYQTFFNLFYMQSTAAIFRMITWAVIAGTVAPWMAAYWRDMGIATIFGTFFGTLGFFGVNSLYNKGRIGRNTRSYIQQGRDLFFLLAGTFFASGSMTAYWVLFAVQQVIDISIYLAGRRAQARNIVYAADQKVAATDEFQSMYPVRPGGEPSPLKQALEAVLGNPLVRPVVSLVKALWGRLTKKKK